MWYDEGRAHEITQKAGGEQGDPLMPALYALGQHAALVEVNETLHENEHIFAYLDDTYVLSKTQSVCHI